MTPKILPSSEVRNHFADVLEDLHHKGQTCLVTKNGRAVAALLPIEAYEQLMSDLEDRLDEADASLAHELAESRQETAAGKTKTLRDLKR